jgi:hypothetical protein
MTDNDIIKVLKCLSGEKVFCAECAYKCAISYACHKNGAKDALDLINRQRAEIAELQHKYDLAVAEREANIKGFTETLERLRSMNQAKLDMIHDIRAEIERKDRILDSYALQYGTVADKDVLLKQAKAEAVKEFAERLCEGRVSNDPVVIAMKVELETVG